MFFVKSLFKSAKWLVLAAMAVLVIYRVTYAPVPVPVFEVKPAVIVVTHDHRSLEVFDRNYEMEDGKLRVSLNAGQAVGR
jgi:hypothetical protein